MRSAPDDLPSSGEVAGGAAAGIDDALVARAQAGDMQAWSRLYHDHFDGLFRHLRYLVGDGQTAEELVQETFVQAVTSLARFDRRSRFSSWLHGIGLNVARHHWRAQRSTAKAHAKLSAVNEVGRTGGRSAPDHELGARQRARGVYEALQTLPEPLREAFILRELEGLSPADAAEQLGITANNLAVRASRARTQLRKQLARMGFADEGGQP